MEELEFLGFIIEKQGVKVDPKKVQAVVDWPHTTKVSEVQQFMGFVQYIKKFIHHFSHIAAPLTKLIKGKAPFHWREAQENVFNRMK